MPVPPVPPIRLNPTGIAVTGSAGSFTSSPRATFTTATSTSAVGNMAVNVFEQFILALKTLCLQHNIGIVGYADPQAAAGWKIPGPIYGMIQLVTLDQYNTDELWNFQYLRYAANTGWRPWPF